MSDVDVHYFLTESSPADQVAPHIRRDLSWGRVVKWHQHPKSPDIDYYSCACPVYHPETDKGAIL